MSLRTTQKQFCWLYGLSSQTPLYTSVEWLKHSPEVLLQQEKTPSSGFPGSKRVSQATSQSVRFSLPLTSKSSHTVISTRHTDKTHIDA